MKTTVSIAEAQHELPKLVRSGETITLVRQGEPVAFLISKERMGMILETMEILANPEAMKAIRAFSAGKTKTIPWSRVEKELDALDKTA
jgi:PHD/YefM family antitoxin component YafN of YafNO toxin-antitoxin module